MAQKLTGRSITMLIDKCGANTTLGKTAPFSASAIESNQKATYCINDLSSTLERNLPHCYDSKKSHMASIEPCT